MLYIPRTRPPSVTISYVVHATKLNYYFLQAYLLYNKRPSNVKVVVPCGTRTVLRLCRFISLDVRFLFVNGCGACCRYVGSTVINMSKSYNEVQQPQVMCRTYSFRCLAMTSTSVLLSACRHKRHGSDGMFKIQFRSRRLIGDDDSHSVDTSPSW